MARAAFTSPIRRTKTVRLLQSVRPVSISAVLNAASISQCPIAPGEIVVISGSGLGPAHLASAGSPADRWPLRPLSSRELAVLINDIPAPLVYTSATQVAAIVLDSVSSGMAIGSRLSGPRRHLFLVAVAAAAPGIFTADASGRGHMVVVTINQDGFIDAAANGGDTMYTLRDRHRSRDGELIVHPDDPSGGDDADNLLQARKEVSAE